MKLSIFIRLFSNSVKLVHKELIRTSQFFYKWDSLIHNPCLCTKLRFRTQFVHFNQEFVTNELVIAEFAINEMVITELAITKFVIRSFIT
jgi:hypothetical protein